ncbi:uncharacterized protein LOC112528198 isoform X2 [Cynara cardunculus var. scolymus]|uniref:uncharacterized protein LOC112528198 isoform X2 n=1 Tax=Cynara cardunculus var. scolymus TaxID=59895 RepID=UPI000D6232D6|nr:uncharacterized protein LOC112528198 isoform X2 [Cynara cardunculus var. scolymus]
MVKNGSKMPTFCLTKIRPHVRVRSPTIQLKENADSSIKTDDHKTEDSVSHSNEQESKSEDVDTAEKPVNTVGRKVMIVVDSSIEARNALQWALTHTVQSHDIVVLLHVKKITSKQGFLCSMKNSCQLKRSDVEVEISMVEGKEKGRTIVEEAKRQEVTMLVLGQKKQLFSWRLLLTWAGRPVGGGGMVDYCVQNATCMAVAVRRKSKRVGGYLITTKRQKDFWLLA